MNSKLNNILACVISAAIVTGVSYTPIITATAYAPDTSTVFTAVENVSLNRDTITLGKGDNYNLRAKITPSDSSSKSLMWMSSNSKVAYVDGNGKVIAKGVGTATISAIAHNGKKSLCYVKVQEAPTNITLNYHNIELGVGESCKFNSYIPANTISTRVYTSSDNKIASFVSGSTLIAKKEGTITVTVKTFNGKTDTCKVTVKKAPSGIFLNKNSIILPVGDKSQLDTSLPNGTASFSKVYSSSDESIVSCSENGSIEAKAAGTAYITVTTFNGVTDKCKVTVKRAPESISVRKNYAELYPGDTFKIYYSIPSNTYTKSITYSSSDTSVATVDKSGLVTAKNSGSARITVKTSNNKTAFVDIDVIKLPEINEWSSDADILNSVRVSPSKTNSKLLDDKIDSIFGSIINSKMSNAQKVQACFDWLATNISYAYISYDYSPVYGVNYTNGNDRDIVVSAYSTLVKRLGNCYDYACTLAAVMQRLGYDAHVVHGLVGMSAGGYGNHYWVDTNINGRHYIFDAQVENNNLGWGGTVNHYFYCLRPETTSMYIYQETWSTDNFKTY